MTIPVLKEDRKAIELESQPVGRAPKMTEEQSRTISRRHRNAYVAAFNTQK
ncbi:hypothetical protein [Geopseudomonas aromaticivorans]